jgi:large subunit ribosomal protein L9
MQVILQEKVANLGGVGAKVDVRPGYARNFLIPKGKATPATERYLVEFEARRAELEQIAADVLAKAQTRATALTDVVLKILARASEEGKLFGSVGPREVAEAAAQANIDLNKSEVHLPFGPIRQTGEHEIVLQLHSDVETKLKLLVERSKE